MLTDYDAKAVAEVLGIGFLRTSDSTPAIAAEPATETKRSRSQTSSRRADIVIYVNGSAVQVVELKAGRPVYQSNRGRGRIPRISDLKEVSPPSPVLIEKAVESGLPRKALRHVAEWLAGGDTTKISRLEWGVVPKTTLDRRERQLSPEESERTERVARLFVHARRALGTEAEAREFMIMPHPQLDGRSPIDAARTDLGTRRTEQILNALEYGLAL
ncbi:MAG: DUF2384 domain-containing protein [Acetobacteraceae bacterium]|nr:DUF2384 domain-containing protein [Acetobacteraceae bacterium]